MQGAAYDQLLSVDTIAVSVQLVIRMLHCDTSTPPACQTGCFAVDRHHSKAIIAAARETTYRRTLR